MNEHLQPSKLSQQDSFDGTIDISKFIMALLVVGIHTGPFESNIWLDRGFAIITRLCVPFFFVTSAYFYWLKDSGPLKYVKRILVLYFVWVIIDLPIDIPTISGMTTTHILAKYLWSGFGHLWFLVGSAMGLLITYFLIKLLKKPRTVFIIAVIVLLVACIKTTWEPLFEKCFRIHIVNFLGMRNGLFYGFPYMALGMIAAKSADQSKGRQLKPLIIGFTVSLIALIIESIIFVIIFKTSSTVMWLSVLPYTYFFFMIANNVKISIGKNTALMLRKMSTLIYVSQKLFIRFWSKYFNTMALFLLVCASTIIFAFAIIKLSETKRFKWLTILY